MQEDVGSLSRRPSDEMNLPPGSRESVSILFTESIWRSMFHPRGWAVAIRSQPSDAGCENTSNSSSNDLLIIRKRWSNQQRYLMDECVGALAETHLILIGINHLFIILIVLDQIACISKPRAVTSWKRSPPRQVSLEPARINYRNNSSDTCEIFAWRASSSSELNGASIIVAISDARRFVSVTLPSRYEEKMK